MADDAQDTQTADDILPQVKSAIEARSSYFLDQADSLTFEKVRRLLEKDLGLEAHALDVHKRLVKQWLQSCVVPETSDLPKSQADAGEIAVISTDEAPPVDELQVKNEVEETHSGGDETMEDSPVMGLMTGPKKAKINVDAEDTESKPVPSEITIKKAIWARASYLKENSESITMGGLRRLLEEDLKVEKHSLDPFKKFVGQQVDEALNSTDVSLSTASEKKNSKDSHKKAAAKSSKEETPTSSGNESDEEEEVKVKKRSASKRKPQKTEAVKKRKKSEVDVKGAKQKQSKPSKSIAEGSGEEDAGDVSENDNSDSSAEKPVKKEVPKPAYGKQVERLRSVIKSCGLSISPAIYKKVKQAPENKREAYLKKELEEILAKEGLSSNPSEKEIKDVKKRKERAKELEGIDLSNIVSSGRRRSTTSFIPPPKPDIPDISESESESDDDEDEEEEADEEVENEEANEDQENGDKTDDGSHNEESDKGNSDSD